MLFGKSLFVTEGPRRKFEKGYIFRLSIRPEVFKGIAIFFVLLLTFDLLPALHRNVFASVVLSVVCAVLFIANRCYSRYVFLRSTELICTKQGDYRGSSKSIIAIDVVLHCCEYFIMTCVLIFNDTFRTLDDMIITITRYFAGFMSGGTSKYLFLWQLFNPTTDVVGISTSLFVMTGIVLSWSLSRSHSNVNPYQSSTLFRTRTALYCLAYLYFLCLFSNHLSYYPLSLFFALLLLLALIGLSIFCFMFQSEAVIRRGVSNISKEYIDLSLWKFYDLLDEYQNKHQIVEFTESWFSSLSTIISHSQRLTHAVYAGFKTNSSDMQLAFHVVTIAEMLQEIIECFFRRRVVKRSLFSFSVAQLKEIDCISANSIERDENQCIEVVCALSLGINSIPTSLILDSESLERIIHHSETILHEVPAYLTLCIGETEMYIVREVKMIMVYAYITGLSLALLTLNVSSAISAHESVMGFFERVHQQLDDPLYAHNSICMKIKSTYAYMIYERIGKSHDSPKAFIHQLDEGHNPVNKKDADLKRSRMDLRKWCENVILGAYKINIHVYKTPDSLATEFSRHIVDKPIYSMFYNSLSYLICFSRFGSEILNQL